MLLLSSMIILNAMRFKVSVDIAILSNLLVYTIINPTINRCASEILIPPMIQLRDCIQGLSISLVNRLHLPALGSVFE